MSRPATLTDWLRGRSDAQLARLLELRPDLAVPAPPDIPTLAARLSVRASLQRALDSLDAYQLAVLSALVLEDPVHPVPADRLARWLVEVDPAPALDRLRAGGLAWGHDDAVHLVAGVDAALGAYPAGLGRSAATLFDVAAELPLVPVRRSLALDDVPADRARAALAARLAEPHLVAAVVDELDDDARDTLLRLAAGPPVGTTQTLDVDAATPARRLLDAGLLAPIDTQTVELPREVALALRTHPLGAVSGDPPPLPVTERTPAELDSLGSTVVLDVLRLVAQLAEDWAIAPPAQLRSGGLGVRDLRRTARELDVGEPAVATLVEVGFAAGLIAPTLGVDPHYLPTAEFDAWLEREPARRWLDLASAWLAMSRQPALVGQRGERDRVIAALSPDVERGTIAGLRHTVFDVLAGLAPGDAPTTREAVLERLAWQAPRRASGLRRQAAGILEEADLLGVTAAGGLTGYSRTLLAGSPAVAEQVLAGALPPPVHEMLIQPDLTIVVPGPPDTEMAEELAAIADLESSGGAHVYRISEATVRRAMDTGRSRDHLTSFLTETSRTPVPQALQYLIDDADRRHGVLRAGGAGSYLRSEDTDLLTQLLADPALDRLELRRLAPTVVVSAAPPAELLRTLREHGSAPAAEAPDGGVLQLGDEPARAPSRPPARVVSARARTGAAEFGEAVRRMRAGDAHVPAPVHRPQPPAQVADVAGVTSASLMAALRQTIRSGQTVLVQVADGTGATSDHRLVPISMAGGFVRGHEPGRPGLVSFPIHRIQSVEIVAEAE